MKTVVLPGVQAGKEHAMMENFRRISMLYIDSAVSKCTDGDFEKAISEACPFMCQDPKLISMKAWEECKASRLSELPSSIK